MGEEPQPALKRHESPAIWGQPSPQNIKYLIEGFTQSTHSFLATLQAMRDKLEEQIQKVTTLSPPSVVNPFGGFPMVRRWRPCREFDYSLFTASALEVHTAWHIAGRSNSAVADFDGESLKLLARLFDQLRYQPISNDGSDADAIADLSLRFKTEVERFELLLSLTSPKEETPPQKPHAYHPSSVLDAEEPDAEKRESVEPVPQSAGTMTLHSEGSQNKTGTVTDADRAKVQDAIDTYRSEFNNADPTIDVIRKRTDLGPGKIMKITEERRASGEWAVPKRNRRKK